ncbi:MAG TPA: class I SAM-dependent methyltransferase [Bryobacteraceae bacterium]|nr:class I SAM-dependent methyltransferase [Bryobacteraceae bacterium]
MIERNTEFDPFAAAYNRFWGADYHAQAFPIVEKLLLSRLPPRAAILDLCCGTGQFTARVQQLGFRVHGIDASERMIGYARVNAPRAEFKVADARSFSLGGQFDAAYSVFESLNHVPDLEGLETAFSCVRRHLRDGACFLFDLNREEAFLTYWNDIHAIVEADSVCALRSHYEEDARVGTCNITTFELEDGCWTRNDFAIRQTCHDVTQVHESLLSAGFGDVSLLDSRDAGMTGDIACARTFFLATAA